MKNYLLWGAIIIVFLIYEFKEDRFGIFDNYDIPFSKEYLNCKLIGESISNEFTFSSRLKKNEYVYTIDKIRKIIFPSHINKKHEIIKETYNKGLIETKIYIVDGGKKQESKFVYNRFNKELKMKVKYESKDYEFISNCQKIK